MILLPKVRSFLGIGASSLLCQDKRIEFANSLSYKRLAGGDYFYYLN
jgi:hypothetical protein